MRIYLAASFPRLMEMREKGLELEEMGGKISSRWIKRDPDMEDDKLSLEESILVALEDWVDLFNSDLVVMFTEVPSKSKGGRHTEYGMALALGKKIAIVGPRENIFQRLPITDHFSDWSLFKKNFFVYKNICS